MSYINQGFEEEFEEDEYLNMGKYDEKFIRNNECDCEFCEAEREMMEIEDLENSKSDKKRSKDFVEGILEKDQILHKFAMDKHKAANERLKLAMSFLESQGYASVIVNGNEAHRLSMTDGPKNERERAMSAAFDYITSQFKKK